LTKAALLAPLPITSFFEGKLWGSSSQRLNFNFIKGKEEKTYKEKLRWEKRDKKQKYRV